MAQAHRIENSNDGQIVYIALDPDGVWARSEFPHPLVTVDYDADEEVIGISAAGSKIDGTLEAFQAWHRATRRDTKPLIKSLNELREEAAVA